MTSVIHSARNSTASVFDFVGTTANVANQLVRTAARSVDALDSKAELMHKRVTANTRPNPHPERILSACRACIPSPTQAGTAVPLRPPRP